MPFVLPHAPRIVPPGDGIIRNGLISRWPLDDDTGSTTTRDDQGSNIGTLQGMDPNVDWVEGRLGGDVALEFKGSPRHVLVNHVAELNLAHISVCLWFKYTASQPNWAGLIGKTNSSWNNGWGVYASGDTLNFFYGNYNRGASTAFPQIDRNWHLVIGTYDGATKRIFIDDVEGTPYAYVEDPVTPIDDLRLAHLVGGGHIMAIEQDVRIYDRALSSAERTAIFNGTG